MKKRKLISAKVDYSTDLLPQTRKDQFFNLLKNQYLTIFKVGLILLLVMIPFLACDVVRNLFDRGFYNELASKKITEQEYHFFLFVDLMVQTGIELLFIPVLSIGISGANHIFKEMVEGEHVLFSSDFKTGIKSNYSITLIISLIAGAILCLVRFITSYFIGLFFVTIPVYVLFVIIIIPLTLICLIFSSYYQGNYFNVLSNSTKLYPNYWWQYLVSGIVVFIVIYLPNLFFDGALPPYVKTLVFALFSLLLLPLGILLLHIISITMFDKYVNAIYYPENLHRGLYIPKKEQEKKKGTNSK